MAHVAIIFAFLLILSVISCAVCLLVALVSSIFGDNSERHGKIRMNALKTGVVSVGFAVLFTVIMCIATMIAFPV